MALMPDYLAEELCFPRDHVGRFWGKVWECLCKRVEVVAEE